MSAGGGSWLAQRAAREPDRVALREGARTWRFAELLARARRRGAALAAAGVGPGDRVALLLPSGADLVAWVHAIDALGATLLPLHLRLRDAELAFQLDDAAPRILVHGGGDLAGRARALREATGVPLLASDAPPGSAIAAPAAPVDPERPLALLYTSGTTGRPKGALLPRRAFRASAEASGALLGVRRHDVALACLPLYHVGGLSLLTRSVLHGTALVLHERFDPERVSRALDAGGVTHLSLVPTMLAQVLDARGDRPPPATLRYVLLGGAAAPEGLLARAAAARFPVAPTYGLTEATSQVATRPPGAAGGLVPLPGLDVRIAGEEGRPLPPGEAGEIVLRGPTLFAGYHARPEATARALRAGALHTGDLGRLDGDGGLHVLDRRTDLIVSGGENVYPAEIERVLLDHPHVVDAGVTGVPDPRWGARPAAWVVLRGGDGAALPAFCRERLAGYKVPVAFHAVDALPRNALGKLQRARLVRADARGAAADA